MNAFKKRWKCDCTKKNILSTGVSISDKIAIPNNCPKCNGTGIIGTLDDWLMPPIGELWIAWFAQQNNDLLQTKNALVAAYSHLLGIAEHLGIESAIIDFENPIDETLIGIINSITIILKQNANYMIPSILYSLKTYAKSQGIELEET